MEPKTRFYTQVVILLTLVVLFSAGGGLTIVSLRREIDDSARRTHAYERESARLSEKILYLDGQIARLHTAEALEARLAASGMSLRKPSERQIVRLEARPAALLAEAAAREAASPAASADLLIEPFRTTYGLALLGRD